MILAQVVDSIVSTDKHPALKGHVLLWVRPIRADGSEGGDPFIALDNVSAGPGDTVLVCNEGTGCRQLFDIKHPFPVNHVIAAFVDVVSHVSV